MSENTNKKSTRDGASFLQRLVRCCENIQRQLLMKRLRQHLSFFGIDTSYMTDDEVATHLVEAGQIMAKCGVSAKKAASAITKAAQLMTK